MKKQETVVVGIGASAGGLEALQTLFDNMPEDTGMAFVIVQHLSPTFKSMMDELLAKHTNMPIKLANNNIVLKPNHVYLNPKEKNIIYHKGKIKHVDKTIHNPLNLPIDLFFHSLGDELGENCIGIILSGTGTDGSRGIATIKGSGGMVIVQNPESAQFDGMPITAINSGHAEFIAPPEEIGVIIDRITSNFLYKPEDIPSTNQEDLFNGILDILYRYSGIDFRLYKNSTLLRRIEKRLTINQLNNLQEYAQYVQNNESEQDFLVKDCLIGVTAFFRDSKAFIAIKEKVFPNLFNKDRKKNAPVRFWVSACSAGQEAYTLAMMIDEYLRDNKLNFEYKIFATDVDKESVQIAAEGKYPLNYVADLPKTVLENYFIKSGDFFEINKRVREKIVFSQHNLLKDPPFIKMDFVSCRNFLIYLLPKAQYKVLGTFQFGLNKGGYLFLGNSETLGESQKLFETVDAAWRIYQSTADYKELPSRLQTDMRSRTYDSKNAPYNMHRGHLPDRVQTERVFTEKIASRFGPACVFINKSYDILHINGDINDYISLKPGTLKNSFIDILVDDKLVAMVRNGIRRIGNENKKVIFKDLAFKNKSQSLLVNLTFELVEFEGVKEEIVLISFEKNERSPKKEEAIIYDQYKLDEFSKQRIEDLEADLKKTKQELQNTIEELETSNEELQASNEELQASNEELQSTNEELQSVNEELYTVNAEVQVKNKELIELNEDVTNILDSTYIGTLFLDTDLRIRKFTPALQSIFQLKEADLGRPISNFASNFAEKIRKQFIKDSKKVLETGDIIEVEFEDDDGNFFLRKISPFLNSHKKIEGLVISFVDITPAKLAEREVVKQSNYIKSIYNAAQTGIYVYNLNQGINEYINARYTEILGYTLDEINAMSGDEFFALFHPDDQKAISDHMQEVANLRPGHVSVIEYRFKAKNGEWCWCLSHDTGYDYDDEGKIVSFVGSFLDITNARTNEEKLIKANLRLERSEFNLLQAQKIAGLGSWYLDVETNEVEWTEELYHMYGFDPTVPPPPYTEHMKLFAPESWEQLSTSLAKTREEGIPYELELQTIKKDGGKGWMWVRGEAIRNDRNEIIALWGVAQDITTQKKVENQIRESEKNYKSLFSNQINAIAVHEMVYNKKGEAIDFIYRDGNFLQDELMGMKRDSYINKKVSKVLPGFAEQYTDLFNAYAEVAATGKSNQFEIYYDSLKRWYRIKTYSHKNAYFVTLSDDITEQKKIMADFENAMKFNVTLTENSPYGVIVYNEKSECVFVNNKAIKTLRTKQELLIHNKLENTIFSKSSILIEIAAEVLKTGNIQTHIEAITIKKKLIWIEFNFTRFNYNKKLHIMIIFQDISQRLEAEHKLKQQTEQLIQSEKMNAIGTLVAGVAHELNNPLMSILNFTSYCKKHVPDNNKAFPILENILEEAKRGADVVSNLLTYSRKEEASGLDSYCTDLPRVIDDCLKIVKLKIKDSEIVIDSVSIGDIFNCNIKHQYAQQVIFNMLDNALYAVENSKNKTIKIKVTSADEYTIVTIEDSGVGISKANLNKIFDPFFTTKPNDKGTGLGLSICHNIIAEAGGKIECESEPNKGTLFTIYIPIV